MIDWRVLKSIRTYHNAGRACGIHVWAEHADDGRGEPIRVAWIVAHFPYRIDVDPIGLSDQHTNLFQVIAWLGVVESLVERGGNVNGW